MWKRCCCSLEVFISAEGWLPVVEEWKGHNSGIIISTTEQLKYRCCCQIHHNQLIRCIPCVGKAGWGYMHIM